jgi:hypothetical protein
MAMAKNVVRIRSDVRSDAQRILMGLESIVHKYITDLEPERSPQLVPMDLDIIISELREAAYRLKDCRDRLYPQGK